jgi:hypothetical protein
MLLSMSRGVVALEVQLYIELLPYTKVLNRPK